MNEHVGGQMHQRVVVPVASKNICAEIGGALEGCQNRAY